MKLVTQANESFMFFFIVFQGNIAQLGIGRAHIEETKPIKNAFFCF